MKRSLFVLLAVVLLSTPLWTDYKNIFDNRDYAAILKEIKPLAQKGDAKAQDILGYLYANGHGVRKDYVQAYMWWYVSASQGDNNAEKNCDMLSAKMRIAQIMKARTLAGVWRPKK